MRGDAEQDLKFEAERTQPSADLISRLYVRNPKKILDVGCGSGNSMLLLKEKYPDAEILGIDKSPEMIETAKKNNPDIDFKVTDAETSLKTVGSGYDIVCGPETVFHGPAGEKK